MEKPQTKRTMLCEDANAIESTDAQGNVEIRKVPDRAAALKEDARRKAELAEKNEERRASQHR